MFFSIRSASKELLRLLLGSVSHDPSPFSVEKHLDRKSGLSCPYSVFIISVISCTRIYAMLAAKSAITYSTKTRESQLLRSGSLFLEYFLRQFLTPALSLRQMLKSTARVTRIVGPRTANKTTAEYGIVELSPCG